MQAAEVASGLSKASAALARGGDDAMGAFLVRLHFIFPWGGQHRVRQKTLTFTEPSPYDDCPGRRRRHVPAARARESPEPGWTPSTRGGHLQDRQFLETVPGPRYTRLLRSILARATAARRGAVVRRGCAGRTWSRGLPNAPRHPASRWHTIAVKPCRLVPLLVEPFLRHRGEAWATRARRGPLGVLPLDGTIGV